MSYRMNWNPPPEVVDIMNRALKAPLVSREERAAADSHAPVLDQSGIEGVLPHRNPFLLVDRVTLLDVDRNLIVGHYDLARAADVLAGHFPAYPVWPGALQVEAITQTGTILALMRADCPTSESFALVRTLARFLRPIVPGADVEIICTVAEDGLLGTMVGQCLQHGAICSVAAVTGM
jgi:3-hydroxymyristoyl/3-hydroxydecanoyl-(acyl carrier protein) dehydratase